MARLILDTTILIAAQRAGTAIDRVIDEEDDAAIAAVTAAELLAGVELASARHRGARERLVEAILSNVTIEDYDLGVARAHAALLGHTRRTGRPRGAHDLIIAATALARSRIVVTAGASGFDDLPNVAVRAPS